MVCYGCESCQYFSSKSFRVTISIKNLVNEWNTDATQVWPIFHLFTMLNSQIMYKETSKVRTLKTPVVVRPSMKMHISKTSLVIFLLNINETTKVLTLRKWATNFQANTIPHMQAHPERGEADTCKHTGTPTYNSTLHSTN